MSYCYRIVGLLGFVFVRPLESLRHAGIIPNRLLQAIILPGNFIYIGISVVGTKLYANSVLAVYAPFDPSHLSSAIADRDPPPLRLNSRRALANKMLAGFEMDSFDPQNVRMRPHTVVETWDVPQLPVDLRMMESHMSFATPVNIDSSFDSDTARTGNGSHIKPVLPG